MIIKKNIFTVILTFVVLLSANVNALFTDVVSAVSSVNTILDFSDKSQRCSKAIGLKEGNYKNFGMKVVRVMTISLFAGAGGLYVFEKVKEYKDKKDGVNQNETSKVIKNYYILQRDDESLEDVLKTIDASDDG